MLNMGVILAWCLAALFGGFSALCSMFWLGMLLRQVREHPKSGAVSVQHNCIPIVAINGQTYDESLELLNCREE